jgi:hypothetical protein
MSDRDSPCGICNPLDLLLALLSRGEGDAADWAKRLLAHGERAAGCATSEARESGECATARARDS